ncbi:hypothetical protein DPEC_G00103840 [Dallia pectoralis]|uniref:Uncharacterized protein n=1 Tax=Dallia pectoralis TaxID=75939 RepID=A0ACC2GXJ9_DALPE|nr:hypothetical protein DPEC_G00103840 [Dallia pectoralis]
MYPANETWTARFSQEPADQSVVRGQRVILSCVVFNYSGIVQWTKDGLALGIGEDLRAWPRYRVLRVQELGQYNLEILSAELSDDSLYECQAPDAALRSRRAKLTVLIPPDEPVIDGAPEVLLNAGGHYNLSCVSRGAKPPAIIEWLKDGLPVDGAVSTTEVLPDRKRVTTNSLLPIHPVDTDTGRNYSCVASNLAIPSGRHTTVSLNVHHPPTVTLSIEPRSVLEGDRVTFTCAAAANPPIMGYMWAKGGVILQGARESVFTTKADHSFFTEPVSCSVFNAVGKTNVSILVDVHFGPILVVEPKPVTVDIDSDVTLNCKWAGNPPLTLTWTKKGSNMVLSNNNQLFLKSVSQADAGQYVCKAIVPRIGVGETEVTLTVNGPPIISSEQVQFAARGERGEVKCYIASTPPPDKIVWAWKENVWEKEKGTLLERYTVEQSKPLSEGGAVLSTLTINNVIESDFLSTYNCTAWNAFGPGTMIITLEETGTTWKNVLLHTFGQAIPIISQNRFLTKRGELQEMVKGGTLFPRPKFTPVLLFLFNDLLIIATKKGSERFVVLDHAHRSLVQIQPIGDDPVTRSPYEHCFNLTLLENHQGRLIERLMKAPSQSDLHRWMAAFPNPSNPDGDDDEIIYDDWDCPQVQCVEPYAAQQADELTLEPTEIINVVRKTNEGMCEGIRLSDGQKGWFPMANALEITNEHVRRRNLRERYRVMRAASAVTHNKAVT